MTLPLSAPALLIIDMQNDFVRVGAPLEVPASRATIPVIGRLAAAFRAAGRPVVFTRYVADAFYRPLAGRLPWIRLLEPPVEACVPGRQRHYPELGAAREGVAVIDELQPRDGDLVLDKIYYSAFHRTDLDDRLRALGVGSVVVVGTVTEMCVEDTARHAVHHGYPTLIVRDAVSSGSAEGEAAALAAFERNFGWVADSPSVFDLLAPPR